ncbi:TetR/AcrR family transcriptional regulator [Streptomyces sp. NPDC051217]|uniref:TetR/AcrR family transcriptional regulator n=1 Tax=Streptomyces sp. NPDC051217 TaxID=3365644 RepID=UPI0037A2BDB9
MENSRTGQGGKAGYHHGDLRNALIGAGLELATDGGPTKVVLREVARRAGVSATAAYRHFAGQGELLHAVKMEAQQMLADAMERVAAGLPGDGRPGAAAERRLVGIGRGYVGFALEHPGLFRTAFYHAMTGEEEGAGWGGVTSVADNPEFRSYNILSAALDELVAVGRMPAANRPGAEAAAWSTAHGVAMLILDGPMAGLSREDREGVIERSVDTIVAGLLVPRERPAGA